MDYENIRDDRTNAIGVNKNPIQRLPNPYTEYHLKRYLSKGRALEVLNEVIDRVNSIENRLEKLIDVLEITLKEEKL